MPHPAYLQLRSWIEYWFFPIDNSSLVAFRVLFGLLITLESWGAILTGWVKRTFVDPSLTFPFIGLESLRIFNEIGYGMYAYYLIMGILGLMIMLGWYYRLGMSLFFIMWLGTYLAQKTNYNNHYYLLVLLNFWMIFLPVHRYYSLDVKRRPELLSHTCPRWCLAIILAQVSIVYFYAGIAKIYPDWLMGRPIEIWFAAKRNYPLIGEFLQAKWLQSLIVYGGIIFDIAVAPLLLWRKTRLYAFLISIGFHLFNSIVFQVGIFPYLGIGLNALFFPPETLRRIFFKQKPSLQEQEPPHQTSIRSWSYRYWLVTAFSVYLCIQVLLPLRHWSYPGLVHWTEEGHRMSWYMMLRAKGGIASFVIRDGVTKQTVRLNPRKYLTPKQASKVASHPDFLWQFVQFLKEEYRQEGFQNLEIYAFTQTNLNGRGFQPLVDPNVNLAKEPWNRFAHHTWILPIEP